MSISTTAVIYLLSLFSDFLLLHFSHQFKVAAGVGGISCITPKTVYVGGGTLTFNTLNEVSVFRQVHTDRQY